MKKGQSYANHVFYYIPHHIVFYGLVGGLMVYSLYNISAHTDQACIWAVLTAAFALMAFLSFMLRQHYALGNQNRILRIEMRFRYYLLTGQRFEPLEPRLRFRQIAALRFASDEELPALVQRALNEQLSPDDIKKSIINWHADNMRV